LASFASLTAQLNLNIANFAAGMQAASATASQFAANMSGQINAGMVQPVQAAKFEFKDVARIVQGIMISKIFYGGLNAIKQTTTAVTDFSNQLQYAKMVYSNLFGSVSEAQEFINVLKDFSAVTPFTFQQSQDAAKKLLAYGIQAKNVMFVMRGVMSAASVQGNPEAVESISRALGQVYTKGRLMNEEMRQLTDAGIPAYEILQEKLGLTQKQLQNLGKVAVPANEAINALVEGMTERFGSALDMSNQTTIGIMSNIKDNALQLMSGMFEPFTQQLHDALAKFGTFLAMIKSVQDIKGIGGVFDKLIPPALQEDVKNLIINLRNLWNIVKSLLTSAFTALGYVLVGAMKLFNLLAPIVLTVVGSIVAFIQVLTQNASVMKTITGLLMAAAAAWLVFKLQALAAGVATLVVKAIITSVQLLCLALNALVAHPVWAVLAIGVGIIVALTGASQRFGAAINSVVQKFSSLGGLTSKDMLLPKSSERAADLSKFNNALGNTSDGMDKLASSTGAAAKAAKGLLGFDEVFTLPKDETGGAGGVGEDLSNLFDGSGLDDLFKDVDFGTIADNFINNLITAFGGKDKILGAGIGAILGAAFGFLLGGPVGAQIGAVVGAIAGYFWDDMAKALGLTNVGTVALPIATVLGAAIGFLAGGPLGAVIGAAIGALVGWITDSITKGIQSGDWSSAGMPIGIGIGAAIGMIAGGPAGAAIGAAIGALVGFIVDDFIKGFGTGKWDTTGLSLAIGGGVGAAIGMIVGGPVGAIIGAAIGATVGWLVSLVINNWGVISGFFVSLATTIANFFVGIANSIAGFFTGIGNAIASAWNSVGNWFSKIFTDIGNFFTGIGNAIAKAWNDTVTWFATALTNIGNFFTSIATSIGNFFTNIITSIANWASPIFQPLIDAFSHLFTVIGGILSDIWNGLSKFFTDVGNAFETVGTAIGTTVEKIVIFIYQLVSKYLGIAWDAISKFFTDLANSIATWVSGIATAIGTFFTNLYTSISTWVVKIATTIGTFFTNLWTSVTTWLAGAWTSITTWLSDVWNAFVAWISPVLDMFAAFFTDLINKIVAFVSDFIGKVTAWLSDVWNSISKWISDVVKTFVDFFSDVLKKIVKFFADGVNNFADGLQNMWNSVKNGIANIYNTFTNWVSDMWNNVFGKFFTWIDQGIDKLSKFFGLNGSANLTLTTTASGSGTGHAVGGVFNREHVARFAEGNKAEAIIPLQNDTAMQPFVKAVSDGLTASLLPMFAASQGGGGNNVQPLYVGTLIADDRGLRELERRMYDIRVIEGTRR